MKVKRKSRPVAFGSREWFRRVGEASLALGRTHFHEELVRLFGCLIDHDACWIIRFSDSAPPEIMYTHNVSQPLRDHYNSACSAVDPFAAHWRLHKEVGVRALSKFKGLLGSIDAGTYSSIFKPIANVSDELGLFLPTVGNASIGLFLERERGDFTNGEIARAQLAFPILNSFEKAHIGQVFNSLRHGDLLLRATHFSPQPILVQDRYGVEIYSSPSWKIAIEHEPQLRTAMQSSGRDAPIALGKFILNISHVDKYFPLAPQGRIITLEPYPSSAATKTTVLKRTDLMRRLTPREREIFELIINGRSTSDVSRILAISKGTVKNAVLRIYKKSNIHSRRDLIQYFAVRS